MLDTISSSRPLFDDSAKKRVRELQDESPADIAFISDFDLTLVMKAVNPGDDFHEVLLTPGQQETLRELSNTFAQVSILTARGEKSTLESMFPEGNAGDIMLASNSGYRIIPDMRALEAERLTLNVSKDNTDELVTAAINGILESVGRVFAASSGKLTLDPRELCGAIVFQNFNAEDRDTLLRIYEQEKAKIDPVISRRIGESKKVLPASGHVDLHNGYADLKPVDMCKGKALTQLFEQTDLLHRTDKARKIILAGDSNADIASFEAAERLWGKDRVRCVWVGNDPSIKNYTGKAPLIHLSGDQTVAIPSFYSILRQAARLEY